MIKMNKNYIFILALFGMLFLLPISSAFFPDSHKYIQEQVMKDPINSDMYKACNDNPAACFSGNLLSDVSVIFYYTTFNRYAVTHSPAFCKQLLDQANGPTENACAVGGCLHQTQDPLSHLFMVDYAITHTGLPNSIIHPPAEQHEDNLINAIDPGIHQRRIDATESFRDCVPLFKRVLSQRDEYRGVNLDSMFDKFVQEASASKKTGYDPSFNNITSIPTGFLFSFLGIMLLTLFLWGLLLVKRIRFKERRTIWNWITFGLLTIFSAIFLYLFIANLGGKAFEAYTSIIRPLSNFVPIGNSNTYVTQAIAAGRNFLDKGFPVLVNTDPSGGAALAVADKSIVVFQYVFAIILVAVIIALVYLNLRKKKQKGVSYG